MPPVPRLRFLELAPSPEKPVALKGLALRVMGRLSDPSVGPLWVSDAGPGPLLVPLGAGGSFDATLELDPLTTEVVLRAGSPAEEARATIHVSLDLTEEIERARADNPLADDPDEQMRRALGDAPAEKRPDLFTYQLAASASLAALDEGLAQGSLPPWRIALHLANSSRDEGFAASLEGAFAQACGRLVGERIAAARGGYMRALVDADAVRKKPLSNAEKLVELSRLDAEGKRLVLSGVLSEALVSLEGSERRKEVMALVVDETRRQRRTWEERSAAVLEAPSTPPRPELAEAWQRCRDALSRARERARDAFAVLFYSDRTPQEYLTSATFRIFEAATLELEGERMKAAALLRSLALPEEENKSARKTLDEHFELAEAPSRAGWLEAGWRPIALEHILALLAAAPSLDYDLYPLRSHEEALRRLRAYAERWRDDPWATRPLCVAVPIDASGRRVLGIGGTFDCPWLTSGDVDRAAARHEVVEIAGRRWLLPAGTRSEGMRDEAALRAVSARELIVGLDLGSAR